MPPLYPQTTTHIGTPIRKRMATHSQNTEFQNSNDIFKTAVFLDARKNRHAAHLRRKGREVRHPLQHGTCWRPRPRGLQARHHPAADKRRRQNGFVTLSTLAKKSFVCTFTSGRLCCDLRPYPCISIVAMRFNTADGKSLEGNMLVTNSCAHPGLTNI